MLCKLTKHFLPPTSGILVSRISDHFPYFIFLDSLKVKRIKAPKTIEIQIWNAECIYQFKTELNNADIYDSLDNSIATNPNQNLNILNYAISQAKRKHLPSRTVKFNKHKHKISTCITNGILRFISYRDKLYLELIIIIIINLYFRRVLVHIHIKEEEKKEKKEEIHDRKQTKQTNQKKIKRNIPN